MSTHNANRFDDLLDLVGPYRGECGICGGPDARHRVADSIAEKVRAGDDPAVVAADYELPVEAVERIAREMPDDLYGDPADAKAEHDSPEESVHLLRAELDACRREIGVLRWQLARERRKATVLTQTLALRRGTP